MENKLSPPQATLKVPIPTVAEIFSDDLETAYKNEQLNFLLNQEPKKEWIKEHPFIAGHKYIPIDKVEFLLKKIFKKHRVEILSSGTAFNGVVVTVRVHYWNPVTADWDYHDGIGACQLQTKKGTSPADLSNINQGALSMAYPIAKTLAVKDACDHFGKLFGADLNRKDTIPFTIDDKLAPEIDPEIQEQFDLITDVDGLIRYVDGLPKSSTNNLAFRKAFNKRKQELMPKL